MTNYTTSLRLSEPVPGDPAVKNTWGTILNENMVLVEAAILGTASVNIAGLATYILTTANGAVDQARPLVQSYTGALTANCTVTLPNVPKIGYAQNLTTGGFSVILTAGAGATITIPPDGNWYLFSADGVGNIIFVTIGFGLLNSLTISGLLNAGSVDVVGVMTAGEISSQGAASVGSVTTGSLSVTAQVGIFPATGSNTGNGTIGSLGALTGVRIGTYTVTMGAATTFTVTDPQSVSIGSGTVGTPFATQIEFTLTAGSTAFVSGDTFDVTIQEAAVSSLGAAHAGNTGNGTIGAITLLTGYRIGTYVATFSSATAFIVVDPLGNTLGSGSTGVAFATQVGFTITVGATAFVAGDFFDIQVEPSTQIDGNVAISGTLAVGGAFSAASITTTAGLPPGIQFGDIKHNALGIESNGWRLCYGQTRPQTDPFWQYMVTNDLTASWRPGFTGSSTYNMPDARGSVLAGLDNMGGTAANRLTEAVVGFDPTALTNTGGNQSMQSHSHSATDAGHGHADGGHSHSDAGHTHNTQDYRTGSGSTFFGGVGGNMGDGFGTDSGNANIQAGYAQIEAGFANISVAAAGGGGSQNVQPTMITSILMYVGA